MYKCNFTMCHSTRLTMLMGPYVYCNSVFETLIWQIYSAYKSAGVTVGQESAGSNPSSSIEHLLGRTGH